MIFVSTFAMRYLKLIVMENLKFSEEERELVEAIRNYKNSMHNPSFELEEYARMLFDNMMYGNEN